MSKIKDITPSENKKVKNAKIIICDGIRFRSKLEVYTYKQLKKFKIPAVYEQYSFTLVEGFEYKGDKVKKITYKPDFIGTKFIIECKGYANDAWPIRWKLFLKYLNDNSLDYDLYVPRSIKQVDKVIKEILQKI